MSASRPATWTPTSGEQYELTHGDQRVIVAQVGGAVRTYEVAGVAVLDGYSAEDMCPGARGSWLAPWPNRLTDGRYRFGGQEHQLLVDGTASAQPGHALHGLVRWLPWALETQTERMLSVGLTLVAQPGYPFTLSLRATYVLDDDGLTASLVATTVGARPCPYGVGAHPYFTVGTTTIETALLTVPAATWEPVSGDRRPCSVKEVDMDFTAPRPIAGARLGLFGSLVPGAGDRTTVTMTNAETGSAVEVWMDRPHLDVSRVTNRGGVVLAA